MYCVYWTEMLEPCCEFHNDLGSALSACEVLRKVGHEFVTMAVEDPNMVGKMGVSDVDENYDWVKRRDAISVRKKGL